MGRRIPRGAGWRLVAIFTLVVALVATFPQGARAASGIVVSVTDELGRPLAGAAFGVYAATEDADGALVIDPAAPLIGGPVVTDADGLASIADLPDGLMVGVRQLAVPVGYSADAAGDRFLTTDPALPGSLTVVNAALPVSGRAGTVVVTVTAQPGATALGGVSIDVHTADPATGLPGEVVSSTVSDAAGRSEIPLPAGSYVVSVRPPGGYQPAAPQPVALGSPADGEPAVAEVAFGLQPEPTVPPEATVDPTATIPAGPGPTVTAAPGEPTVPTATTAPDGAAVPPVDATVPAATETPASSPNRPAYVAVRAIVCTSDDPEVIGTTVINPNEGLADGGEGLLPECRAAREGEFTFVFRDLRMPNPWDDLTLGQRLTDSDGIALFDTVVTRPGQSVLIFERDSPNDFSTETTVPLVADGTVSLIAIVVTGQPEGDVTVRTVDSVSGQPVASGCYELAAAGAADIPLAAACDADDGADGTVVFPAVANGDYVVVPESTPAGYVVTPSPLTVASQPVDLPVAVTPYGTLQLIARSCQALPPGVLSPTPTPAPGDGIAGLGDMTTGSLPGDGTGPRVVFSSADGSAINATGTGLEGDRGTNGCVAIGASLTVTAPDGTVTAVPVGSDGVALPLALPPSTGNERYVIRDDASGVEAAVALTPAGTTTVTMTVVSG